MRILIVEVNSSEELKRLPVGLVRDKVKSLEASGTVDSDKEALSNDSVGLHYVDLDLREKHEIEALKSAIAESLHTIVISTIEEQSLKSGEVGILDLVRKHITKTHLEKSLLRLKDLTATAKQATTKYLAVKESGSVEIISANNVHYFQGAGIYTEIHLKDGTRKLYEKTLDKLQSQLCDDFFRIHRSYIVQIDQIVRLNSSSGSRYSLDLKNGESLPVGRTKVAALRKRLFD